jgi:hypothetical protein
MSPRYTLEQYARAARRNTELIFETAEEDLTVSELGALSLRLQHLDSKWKLPRRDRALFALELIAAGWKRKDACAAAMISRSTLQRELRKSARPAKWPPEAAFPSGVDASNRGPRGDGSSAARARAAAPSGPAS